MVARLLQNTFPTIVADALPDPLNELCSRLIKISTDGDIDFEAGMAVCELDPRSLIDQLPEFVYVKDRRCRYVVTNCATNQATARLTGGANLIGGTDFDVLDHDTARDIFAGEQRIMSTGIGMEGVEECIRLADGRVVWLATSKLPLRNAAGEIVGLVGISRNITERRRQENHRHRQARLLEMIARGQPLQTVLDALVGGIEEELSGIIASILLLDPETGRLCHGAATRLSPVYMQLVDGIDIGPNVGSCGTAAWRRSRVVVKDVLEDPLWESFRELGQKFGFRSCWSTPIIGTGDKVLGTFALYSETPREPTEAELELTGMATDLAGIAIERARTEEHIRHMAHHDPLTGLPNRTLFWTQFNYALRAAERDGGELRVVYIDLDNFKQINDTLGHAVGDEVLRVLAARMNGYIRTGDLLVRLGGDEFAIVFSEFTRNDELARRLDELRGEISRPITIEDISVTAGCSIGLACYPHDGDTPEALLARADRAMYAAKELRAGCEKVGTGFS